MFSTFMGVEIAKRSLQTSKQTLYVIENNISNAENPDYSRQVIQIAPFQPLYAPFLNMGTEAGQVGQGTYVASIDRVRNQFLDSKINNENSFYNFYDTISKYIDRIDSIYNEPGDVNLNSAIIDFFNSFNDLSLEPESMSKRAVVREKAIRLINTFHNTFNELSKIKNTINEEIKLNIEKVNGILKKIALINDKIKKIEATGQKPNDLYDVRDKLIEDLSGFIDINTEIDHNEFKVYYKGKILVQGNISNQFELRLKPDSKDYEILLDGQILNINNGKIGALFFTRDRIISSQIEKVNQLALSIVEGVNALHKKGMNLKGETNIAFFKELPLSVYQNGEFDVNNDGYMDHAVIYKIVGTQKISPDKKLMIRGTLNINGVVINYNENDTVADLIKRINLANTGLNFYINNGYLEIKGNSSANGIYAIKHLEDSGQFLSNFAGILSNQAIYDYTNINAINNLFSTNQIYIISPQRNIAAWIDLSDNVKNDLSSISAASLSKELKEGDGSIAYKIGKLIDDKFFIRGNSSINKFYKNMITEYSAIGNQAKIQRDNHEIILKNFKKLRASYSGVNLDEELSNMMKFEKVYQATAKFLNQLNNLYDVLIGIIR